MTTCLTLLSYGHEREYRRAIFAILSFWARYRGSANVVTVLFTDNPAFFRPYLGGLPVEYVLLSEARRRAMYGPQHYAFRVKILILQEVMARYRAAHVLYLDSDTFLLRDPTPLVQAVAAGRALMHQPEYTFAEALVQYAPLPEADCPRRLVALLETRIFPVGGQQQQFTRHQMGWNSGVLGLPAAAAALLPEVLALTDAFYAGSGWFTSEQLAFSLALPLQFPLGRADTYVLHYWSPGQKACLDQALARLLTPALGARPLPDRLTLVATRTARWHHLLIREKLREAALYAAGRGRPAPALRFALKALMRAPFELAFVRRLLATLRASTAP